MKTGKRILLGLLTLCLAIVLVFLAGRYGWKLLGFRACQGAGITEITVQQGQVRIQGFYPGSFGSGFVGYYAQEQDGKLYVGYRFSQVFGFFETGNFDIVIPTKGEIREVYIKTATTETLVWPAEQDGQQDAKPPESPAVSEPPAASEDEPAGSEDEPAGSAAQSEPAAAVTVEQLVGPWQLAPDENDEAAIGEAFPGAMEFGSSMEIRSDGRISWYVGAAGVRGTYTLSGDMLRAEMIDDADNTSLTVELTARQKDGRLVLEMEYQNVRLCWSQGEEETGRGE